MIYTCDNCGRYTEEKLTSVYGVQMCEECWDDYLFTDEGRVEFIYSIVMGDCQLSDFDADFLAEASAQWQKNRDQFDMSVAELKLIEGQAKSLGLL